MRVKKDMLTLLAYHLIENVVEKSQINSIA